MMNTEIIHETRLDVVSIKYTWKISHFSICNKESIESPLFQAKDLLEYKWYLQLYPRGTSNDDKNYVSVFIYLSKDSKSDICARSSLKLLNHKMESSIATADVICHFERGAGYKFNNFVSRKYLMNYRSMLLPNDTLTIVCYLRMNSGTYSHTQTKTLENKLPTCKLNILKDLEYILENKIFADISILVSNTSFKAHKAILAARSLVFKEIIKNMPTTDESIIRISDVTSESFSRLLRFMYSGKINNIESDTQNLIYAADKYGVNDLKSLCEDVLCRQLEASNAVHMLKLANKYQTPLLRHKAISIMIGELEKNNKTHFNLETMSESKISHLISAFSSLLLSVNP